MAPGISHHCTCNIILHSSMQSHLPWQTGFKEGHVLSVILYPWDLRWGKCSVSAYQPELKEN